MTICTHNRENYFSEIENGRIKLCELGETATKYWIEIPLHFPYVKLKSFVVMPNHIHGIIMINKQIEQDGVETRLISSPQPSTPLRISDHYKRGGFAKDKNPMLNENLSRIIRWYKGRTTFECRRIYADFQWQTRFHDHIIRNEEAHQKIDYYIQTNPQNWESDKLNGKYVENQ